jgi:TRAP-type C4-dicarboxylate transport system permease large subunit
VIYAIIVEQDVGMLLLAGFHSQIVLGVCLCRSCRDCDDLENVGPPSPDLQSNGSRLAAALPIVAVVVIIIFCL